MAAARKVVAVPHIVYKYTSKSTGKIYIGQTCNSLEKRANHGEGYRNSPHFYSAICLYGWDDFIPEILKDGLTAEEANYWEKYYISLYSSNNPSIGYNIKAGGSDTSVHQKTRETISQKAKERYKDPTKNPMYGRHHSEETKQKLREMYSGEKGYWYGKHLPDDVKIKISKSLSDGRSRRKSPWTEEERQAASKRSAERAKKWSKRVRCIEDDLYFNSIKEAAAHYGVNRSTLSECLSQGPSHKCCGKHFEVVNDKV